VRIIAAVEEAAGIRLLKSLAKGPHEVVAVLATPPEAGAPASNAWNVAASLGLSLWPARTVRDPMFATMLADLEPDVLLNAHSLHIIHASLLKVPRYGAYNLHPGPLPRYAGLNAPSWAIYHGEAQHGVTLHRMDSGVDTGPIVSQEIFDITPEDTGISLSGKCVRLGLRLIDRLLVDLSTDPAALILTPTALEELEYYGRDIPHEGMMSWEWSGQEIVRFVRACDYYPFPSPWGHPCVDLHGQPLGVVKAKLLDSSPNGALGTVVASQNGAVSVVCSDGHIEVTHVYYGDRYSLAADVIDVGTVLADGGFPST